MEVVRSASLNYDFLILLHNGLLDLRIVCNLRTVIDRVVSQLLLRRHLDRPSLRLRSKNILVLLNIELHALVALVDDKLGLVG